MQGNTHSAGALVAAATLLIAAPPSVADDGPWRTSMLFQGSDTVGGVTVGDADPLTEGNEIVAVTSTGEIWLLHIGYDARSTMVHKAGGELIMCAIGDVDPAAPGNEIIAVGMVSGPESMDGAGQVVVLAREGDGWRATQALVDDHMVHGVAVGDVDPGAAGNEIVACGFNHRVRILGRADTGWTGDVAYVGNDRMKIATIDDVLPERSGLEVLVGSSDGRVMLLHPGGLGWVHRAIYTGPSGQSRVASHGATVLSGGDDGAVTRIRRTGATWSAEIIAQDTEKIRGVAIADTLGDGAPWLFACGYSGRVMHIDQADDGTWTTRTIYSDARPLHHLAAGELDAAYGGLELVTCGHGGRIIMLAR